MVAIGSANPIKSAQLPLCSMVILEGFGVILIPSRCLEKSTFEETPSVRHEAQENQYFLGSVAYSVCPLKHSVTGSCLISETEERNANNSFSSQDFLC